MRTATSAAGISLQQAGAVSQASRLQRAGKADALCTFGLVGLGAVAKVYLVGSIKDMLLANVRLVLGAAITTRG